MEFWWNFGFQIYQIFLKKKTIILLNSLIKSRIHTIKNTKILRIFWQLCRGKIEKKMLKILTNKKANSKRWNSENVLYFKYIYFSQ